MTITRIKKGKPHLFSDVGKWGGKGDSLLKLGEVFDVPEGFVISSDVYRRWAQSENEEGIRIEREEQTGYTLQASLQRALSFIKNLGQDQNYQQPENNQISGNSVKTRLDQDLVSLLEKEFSMLGKPVAVRSSAISEDGTRNSYAGRFDTVLGVSDFNGFLDAIAKVYQSLHSQKAVQYRENQGIGNEDSIAVVVQRMIQGEASGVAYSRAPNNPDQVLIESTFGLCTTVVDGRACDVYRVVSTQNWGVFEDINKRKSERDAYEGNKIVTKKMPWWMRARASLGNYQAIEVARIIKAIERAYGMPMEMEFTYEKGKSTYEREKLYILQARPITGLMIEEDNVVLPQVEDNKVLARSRNIRKQGMFEGPVVVVRGIDHANRSINIDGNLEEMDGKFSDGYILLAPEIPPQLEEHITNARAMVVTECGTTGHAAAIAAEKGIIYMGRATGDGLLERIRSGTTLCVAASKDEGILYLAQ